MEKTFRLCWTWIAAGGAASLAIAGPSLAQNAPRPADIGRMDQIVRAYIDNKQFMGSVLVAKAGDILLDKGYGYANLEWRIPNDPDTIFRLGSLTKQFTAASILLLEERGKLKTSDPVSTYLPDAPAAWAKITIFNLLTHTSGIPNFTEFPDYVATEAFATTPAQLVGRFENKPLDFQPGEKWSYSNSNYALLGLLIEKVSGQSYKDFLQQNIFSPLKMTHSGYDSHAAIIPHRASGYTPGPNGPQNAGYIDMTVPFAAGALYSTTRDLKLWEDALFGGKLLSAASLKKMTTPFLSGYAMGLGVGQSGGHTVISHNGGIEGFNTYLAYYPDERMTVVVLGNLNGGAPGQIGGQLAAVVHGETVVLPAERREIAVDPKILASYVGSYELTPGFALVVTLEDGHLMTQATGQSKIPIFAESATRFFPKVVDAEIEFTKDKSGAVTGLILHQGGRDMPGPRKP
jgi:CubicO group peptidase (beta-lactamase class C family)